MDQKDLRLELLKLTYSSGREASEAVTRAKELEEYVLENSQGQRPVKGKPDKRPAHLQKQ